MNIFESMYIILVAGLPALSSILGFVVAIKKFMTKHKETSDEFKAEVAAMKEEIKSTKEYKAVKEQLVLSHQENVALQKKINELLTKIDHIQRGEDTHEQTN